MTLLTGMTEDGTEVPVQVKPDGRLVAEGLPGPAGGVGPAGPAGPQGPQGVKGDTGTTVLPPPLFVDGSGLGIGGSPLTELHLCGSSSQTIRIDSDTSAGFFGITGYITQIGANRNPIDGSIVNAGTATVFINLDADVSNGSIQFCTTGTNNAAALERMRITSDGKAGIGTQSPTSVLDVNGDFRLRDCGVFADNAAAVAGGLGPGDVYRTATGQLMIAF